MIEESYEDEYKNSQKQFIKLISRQNFLKGLLLASNSILSSLDEYMLNNTFIKERTSFKKFIKLESSLIKYLARLYTKASPFSTFTTVGIASFVGKAVSIEKNIKENSLKLNNSLYEHMYGLLINHKYLRNFLDIKLNFTIRKQTRDFTFLTIIRNNEALQRISITPILECTYELAKTKKTWRYKNFIFVISTRYPAFSVEQLKDYIDQLLACGFLEYDLGLSGLDPKWDQKLLMKLDSLSYTFPFIRSFTENLKQVKEYMGIYESASYKKRRKIIDQAATLLELACRTITLPKKSVKKNKSEGMFQHTYKRGFPFKVNTIWYEDTYFRNVITMPQDIKMHLELLGEYLHLLTQFHIKNKEKLRIENFFKSNYHKKNEADLLEFYRKYSLSERKSQLSKTQEQQVILDTIVTKIIKKWDVGQSIFLNSTDLQINKNKKISQNITPSYGAFFQISEEKGQNNKDKLLVLNGTSSGYGRMFSRFLSYFDPNITKKILDQNITLFKNKIVSELTDASVFNANMHHPLTEYEIILPGSHNLSDNKKIKITDINIKYSTEQERLLLIEKKSGKEIALLDLSFEDRNTRSSIYRLLSNFSYSEFANNSKLLTLLNKRILSMQKKKNIKVVPRIIYKEKIILQRKRWVLSKESIPVSVPGEKDYSYFIKVNTWRMTHSIPNEIFIIIKGEKKPQFISFTNPFLVKLFVKIISQASKNCIIEEMLPYPSNKQYVSEYFAQWNSIK